MALALLALSGCSDKVADMSCSDIADEAIGISKGALVSINVQRGNHDEKAASIKMRISTF